MRIVHAILPTGERILGRLEGESITPLDLPAATTATDDPFGAALRAGLDLATVGCSASDVPLSDVRLLPPVTAPGKILAIGLNYLDHARESGVEPPVSPLLFVKTPNTLLAPDTELSWSAEASSQVDYEVEMVAIIGRRARDVDERDALDHVWGYTLGNDVSARDAQFADGQWSRGKCFDGFLPVGPTAVSADEVGDPQRVSLKCRIGDELLQDGTTADMIFPVAELIAYLSRTMTLEPGDLLCTGTPWGVGFARTPQRFLSDGDVVECSSPSLGSLRTTCRVISDATANAANVTADDDAAAE